MGDNDTDLRDEIEPTVNKIMTVNEIIAKQNKNEPRQYGPERQG